MATKTPHKAPAAPRMTYAPESLTDPFSAYSEENITRKNANKQVLLDLLGNRLEGKTFLVGVVLSRPFAALSKAEQEMFGTLLRGLEHLEDVYPVVISLAQKDEDLPALAKVASFVLGAHATADMALLSGMDTFVFVEEQPPLEEVGKLLIRFGSGIITSKAKLLPSFIEEYNPYKERGNALLFAPFDPWNAFAAVVRMKEIASFSYDWNTFRRVAMQSIRA